MQQWRTLGGMDLLQHFATFVRIADAGSISAAARSLHLSVPMASRHLRALEEHFTVELVRRTTRHLALTEAGTELLPRARALLADADEAREVLRPGRGAAGLVVLSLPVSFGLSQIAPLFPDLLERHPRLKLDLRFEDRAVDLLGEGVDVAIRAGLSPPDSPFVVARKLATVERALCASPGFLARHGRPKTMSALETLPCVVQGAPPTHFRFETKDGPSSVLVDGRVRSNNPIALRQAALAGLGVAMLPRWMIEEDLAAKRLVQILADTTLPIVEVFGVFHRGSKGSQAIRAVLDFLASELPRRAMMDEAKGASAPRGKAASPRR